METHIGSSTTQFLYNGRDGVMTDSNGLMYMRARYYSPELMRFVNADTYKGIITNSTTLNNYAYANGNPISMIDPFGMSADSVNEGIWPGFIDYMFGLDAWMERLAGLMVGVGAYTAAWAMEDAILAGDMLVTEEMFVGTSKSLFNNGKISVNSIEANPSAFSGRTANEIADMLRAEGYDVTVQASAVSRSGAQIIKINNPGNGRNISQIQVSPGGGRHGTSPYVKISTTDEGIIKIVDGAESTYKTDGTEIAKIIFTGG